MTTIGHHITDAPRRLDNGGMFENVHFITTGSPYGRFLFTEYAPMFQARLDGEQVTFRDCHFTVCGSGIVFEVIR